MKSRSIPSRPAVIDFHVFIPARYASTRLPGKLLLDVCGKSLLERVYERARASGARRAVVATDDERIAQAVTAFGGEVCMTASSHTSGTDRIAEAIGLCGLAPDAIVVNLQGDEPLMPAGLIRRVAERLADDADAPMATASHRVHDREEFANVNVVKVVVDARGRALYFSRAPIPWPRDAVAGPVSAQRHIGLYAYRAAFVRAFAGWGPCELERTEMLEQLRALWHGAPIAVCQTDEEPGPGVDTAEDLERVRAIFERRGASGE